MAFAASRGACARWHSARATKLNDMGHLKTPPGQSPKGAVREKDQDAHHYSAASCGQVRRHGIIVTVSSADTSLHGLW
eukprot:CAMPEP_0117574888 /NCGR_PEP_ID=MMETSP0784-20121206/61880_1 /TAXON_ID=39447 /ORGANISM="" /LENGTH=77 /DNA_ID=CAMNT_0005373855 /DNA_START=107 /DNA_END=338 /DNA_ORIENTATION=-